MMKQLRKHRYINGPSVTVSIRIPAELRARLHEIRKERGIEFATLIRDGLDQWAEAHESVRVDV